jgi:formamidopyrimidine-DNA glycosylase
MPELPEVETIRRDLAAALVNRKIISVNILSPRSASPVGAFFKSALVGRKIIKAARRGKLLIFKLSPGRGRYDCLLIHLKMTGQLIYLDGRKKIAGGHSLSKVGRRNISSGAAFAAAVGGELPNNHTRAILDFSGGGRLFFNDLRKFGYLKLVTADELKRLLATNYGPEPLTPAFTPAALAKVLAGKTSKVKTLLLDQKLIAGLGNIYVDESLYAAGISPLRPAGSLKTVEIKKLYRAINRIIRQAIKHRGTTFSDYVDSHGRHGNFSRFLQVYGRGGAKCRNCGRPLMRIKVAGRGTHYCPHCQK